ncbi:nuclear transport factor 2 family protein [Streptococcus sanguinis]|uniref:nuclear transport factor 2 family protein n=1 Tax=Streptococcus sanguinis TaxID=1305 RepID=UPI00094987EA|nr:nuclear transport factor 2 family protein [Streptococcus sanguinis]
MTDCSHIAFCIILNGLKISLFECLPKLFLEVQNMDTKTLAESYFNAVNKGGWEDFVAEHFDYGMCDSQEIRRGRDVYLQGAGQFYALSQHLEVKNLFVEGREVAALNRYSLQLPSGKELELDVAEFLKFDESDKLIASTIYFDTHRFQEFMQGR